jgi:hypothetical protein
MERVKNGSKGKKLVIRTETLHTLSESSLKAVAGGLIPISTPVSLAHCTGSGSTPTCC